MVKELEELRTEIDRIDDLIDLLLTKRMEICRKIGYIKKKYNIEIRNEERERLKLEHYVEFKNIFIEILKACRNIQESI